MGCGKSKHDVIAFGNTVLQRKKSSVNSKESEAQTVDKSNDITVEAKAPEITNVQEVKPLEKSQETEAEQNKTREIVVAQASERGKDESLEKKNEPEVKDVAGEKQPTEEKKDENEKEDKEETLVKEEESKDTKEETLAKEEESKDTKEETLAKEEETKETDKEKTLVKEGETGDANVSTSTS